MFVADYTGHAVLRIDPKTRKIAVLADEASMNQPNDIAISSDGTIWASDPNWTQSTGHVWRVDKNGKISVLPEARAPLMASMLVRTEKPFM